MIHTNILVPESPRIAQSRPSHRRPHHPRCWGRTGATGSAGELLRVHQAAALAVVQRRTRRSRSTPVQVDGSPMGWGSHARSSSLPPGGTSRLALFSQKTTVLASPGHAASFRLEARLVLAQETSFRGSAEAPDQNIGKIFQYLAPKILGGNILLTFPGQTPRTPPRGAAACSGASRRGPACCAAACGARQHLEILP